MKFLLGNVTTQHFERNLIFSSSVLFLCSWMKCMHVHILSDIQPSTCQVDILSLCGDTSAAGENWVILYSCSNHRFLSSKGNSGDEWHALGCLQFDTGIRCSCNWLSRLICRAAREILVRIALYDEPKMFLTYLGEWVIKLYSNCDIPVMCVVKAISVGGGGGVKSFF